MTDETLRDTADRLVEAVASLDRRVRRSRWQVIILACSVVFDVALSVILAVAIRATSETAGQTADLVARVAQVNSGALAVCVAGNAGSAKQRQLWDGLLALPSTGPPPSPEILAQFQQLLDVTFSERYCSMFGQFAIIPPTKETK
jgi:hypothetical protein